MTLKKFKDKDIVCFAGEDWWLHNPHSNLHIMKEFSAQNRVLFVNSIGVQMPSLGKDKFAGRKILRKLGSMLKFLKKAQPNLWVLTPIALPIIGRFEKIIRSLNNVLLKTQLRLICAFLRFKNPVIWVTVPTVKDVALYLKKKIGSCLVYYCVDNISFFGGQQQTHIAEQEQGLLINADVAYFVNHQLVEKAREVNKNTFYISHGVDYEHFALASTGALPVPEDIKNITQPIVGYVGLIRDLDLLLIESLAHENPSLSFVFIGEIACDVTKLIKYSNVFFLGKKKYEDLPAYIQKFSVNCLYYEVGDAFNDFRNPKKLLEYLATGKPVLSVFINELNYFKNYIEIAKDNNDFNSRLREILNSDHSMKCKERMNFASQHTWTHVAATAGSHILDVITKSR